MPCLTNVRIQFKFKFKILGQFKVYSKDMRFLASKTKFGPTIRFPEGLEDTRFILFITCQQPILNSESTIYLFIFYRLFEPQYSAMGPFLHTITLQQQILTTHSQLFPLRALQLHRGNKSINKGQKKLKCSIYKYLKYHSLILV